jgi:hypothetical protein
MHLANIYKIIMCVLVTACMEFAFFNRNHCILKHSNIKTSDDNKMMLVKTTSCRKRAGGEPRVVYDCGTKEKYPYWEVGGGRVLMALVFRQVAVSAEITATG